MEAGLAEQMLAGRYRLVERIGVGGMAEVYRAEDGVLHRSVAVKVLHPGLEGAEEARRRLQSEVRLLASLSHPGLVSIFDAGTESGRAFLVMQLVQGGTLAQRLASGPIEPGEAARVVAELADVLHYLHFHQMVHRDVKPSNVLLEPSGRVLLTDFGIARALDSVALTGTNTTVGTAAYMAPEQVRGEPVGAPADVYALGLVLNECLSGVRVFQGDNPFAVAAARLRSAPMAAPEAVARWPGLVESMSNQDPDGRPTAAQVAATLREPQTSPGAAPTRGDRTAVMPVPPPSAPAEEPAMRRHLQEIGHRGHRHLVVPAREAARVHGRRASAVASESLGPVWACLRDAVTSGHRAPLVFAAAVTLSLALALGWAADGGAPSSRPSDRASTPASAGTSEKPPGAARLPADLDRLERAVRRR